MAEWALSTRRQTPPEKWPPSKFSMKRIPPVLSSEHVSFAKPSYSNGLSIPIWCERLTSERRLAGSFRDGIRARNHACTVPQEKWPAIGRRRNPAGDRGCKRAGQGSQSWLGPSRYQARQHPDHARQQDQIADLGLAKEAETDVELTPADRGLGTPIYMAPEQFRDAANADARADIYALAQTLYVAITGHVPFAESTTVNIFLKKNDNDFPPQGSLFRRSGRRQLTPSPKHLTRT